MPIGLPEITRKGGRGPEMLVRPLLGQRQSSVFSIPSRAAVYAAMSTRSPRSSCGTRRTARRARLRARRPIRRAASRSRRSVFSRRSARSMHCCGARPNLRRRVIESHPEVAFWRLNGEQAMLLPKKVKGQVNPAGMAERRALAAQPRSCRAISLHLHRHAVRRPTISSMPRRCCSSPRAMPAARRGRFRTRPAWTRMAFRSRSGRDATIGCVDRDGCLL